MPFDWKQVQSNWLCGLAIPYTQQEITEAFNLVESAFGSKFFDKYTWIRGQYIVSLIVDLATILKEIEKGCCSLPPNSEIIRKIRENNVFLADTMIRLAAHYLRNGMAVQFDPELLVARTRKHPDFRVRVNEVWVYVEESRLDISSRQKRATSIMERISNIIETVASSLNIEISLLEDDLSEEDVNQIRQKMGELCQVDQPQVFKVRDLARILTYRLGQKRPYVQEIRPALCLDALRVDHGIECHFHIELPFTDKRIGKVLKERRQLSPETHNMIILDISQVPGNLIEWSESIRGLLGHGKHRRIGAVLLLQKGVTVNSLKVGACLVMHPDASKPLPQGFTTPTKDYFEQSSEYLYRKTS